QAVSAILTGFFGGIAIGSWAGGKLADKVGRPLRLYAILEILLAVIVVATPFSFRLIHEVYRSAFGSLESSPVSLSLIRFALALAALAPATIMMGATLPTLTRHLARRSSYLGAAFARLYLANTIGAAVGAAAAGLVLIELFGLSGALLIGAGCSAFAGTSAFLVDVTSDGRNAEHQPSADAQTTANVNPPRRAIPLTFGFVSGFTSLSCQVLWTRLIASGTGSSTYVFTTILVVFLTGLALGAAEFRRFGSQIRDTLGALAVSQIAIAGLVVAGMYAINALDASGSSYAVKTLVVVLPATFAMGFGFPAASALLASDDSHVGEASGLYLSCNTIGAITGTFIVPFALIPWVGSPGVLAFVAVVNAVTGLALALVDSGQSARRKALLAGASALAGAMILFAVVTGTLFVDPGVARLERRHAKVYQTREDEIASVQSGSINGSKRLWVTGFGMTALTVDARLMPIMPLIARPRSQSILAIAFGMGSSFRSALIAGLKADVVELVPSVPMVFSDYYADAAEVLRNPRGRVLVADGRSYVELTNRTYDIIIVDPPPPLQSSGVSIISSREFYQASERRLNEGGIMMQWVPWGQAISDVKDHIRTFTSVFSNVVVAIGPGGNGFFMLGSARPISLDSGNIIEVLSRPGVLADVSSAYDSPRTDLVGWSRLIPTLVRLTGAEAPQFAGSGPLVTDDRPLPEYFLMRVAFGDDRPFDRASSALAQQR
ncbi:MAG: MFS transporter, partial [Gemmatimonadaceae bacterium]